MTGKRKREYYALARRAAGEGSVLLKNRILPLKTGEQVAVFGVSSVSYAMSGIGSSGNYDLCTVILRGEWGFDGVVYSDWWPKANFEGMRGTGRNLTVLVRAQNDFFMVTQSAGANKTLSENIKKGIVTVAELQRNIRNILRYIMLPIFDRCPVVDLDISSEDGKTLSAAIDSPASGTEYPVRLTAGEKLMKLYFRADTSETAQETITVFANGVSAASIITNESVNSSALRKINVGDGTITFKVIFPPDITLFKLEFYDIRHIRCSQ